MFYPRPGFPAHGAAPFHGAPVAPVQRQMMPPRVHPTQHNVVHKCCEYIVPEVHPSHTTVVRDHMYKHYHNFPHTVSAVDRVGAQHFICPPGPAVPHRRFF